MSKYMNYVGEILLDVDYHAAGDPKDFMEVHTDMPLPFRFYCRMRDEDWVPVTEEERQQLIQELKDTKAKYSKSDHRFYTIDFYLASLGGR